MVGREPNNLRLEVTILPRSEIYASVLLVQHMMTATYRPIPPKLQMQLLQDRRHTLQDGHSDLYLASIQLAY